MGIASNYKLSSTDESDFAHDDTPEEFENTSIDYDYEDDSTQRKVLKRDNNKRNYEAKKKIELLKEERRLRKLFEDDYDDWD